MMNLNEREEIRVFQVLALFIIGGLLLANQSIINIPASQSLVDDFSGWFEGRGEFTQSLLYLLGASLGLIVLLEVILRSK